ncbi:MAG: NADPH:quinone oxidoreductase family protein [Sphingopyxis sp.]
MGAPAIPARMAALMVTELAPDYGGTALVDMPVPVPVDGQALVHVRAASVNFPDLLMTRGEYQLKPPLPFTPGMEFAGQVVGVGPGVAGAMVGRAVIGGNRYGAMAGYVCVPADTLRAKPDALDWAAAAAYRAVYLTAYVSLVRRAAVAPGEWVLVHGAAGGVGLACVDLARHLGARVIATGSSAQKLAMVRQLYAPDAVIDLSAGDFRDEVKRLTGGRGADVIIDPVGGDVFTQSTRCIAFDGRLLVVGFAGGTIATLPSNIPLIKGFSVMGVRAGEYGRQFPDRGAENLAAIDALVTSGAVRPHIHAAMPLSQWRAGFNALAHRQVVGKVVLVPD